jgi:prefoldin subunit 4
MCMHGIELPRPHAQGERAEVTLEDQKRINTFSRLNARMHDLMAQVKAKKVTGAGGRCSTSPCTNAAALIPAPCALQKYLEDLEDAGNELMLSDEETIRFAIGDCFVHIEKDNAEERMQSGTDETSADLKSLNKSIDEIQVQLTVSKERGT